MFVKNLKSGTSRAFELLPHVTKWKTFPDPSTSSVTYFMDGHMVVVQGYRNEKRQGKLLIL